MNATGIYGLMAEFEAPESLLEAARRAYREGYRHMEAYTPYPIEGLPEAIGFHHNRVALCVLVAGLVGALSGYLLQYWISVIDYPLNIGGRPFHSWPAFIPVTFEMGILFGAFGAVIGMLALNGLPRPHHPVFNVSRFELASRDRFFLCIEAGDPKFDRAATEQFLRSLGPQEVHEVEE